MNTFREFVDRKNRRAKKQLKIVEKILKKQNMSVNSFLENDDPYIFLRSNRGGASFEGVRIYKIGGGLAYRIQKEEKTHPYGKAYSLDIESMWDDLIGDKMDEEKAGKTIIKAVKQEFENFFNKSVDAEKQIRSGDFDRKDNPLGNVMTTSQGSDYSNSVHSPDRSSRSPA
jgi:hypothetical protein